MAKLRSLDFKSRICTYKMEEHRNCIADLIDHDNVKKMRQFNHHSSVTCLEHSLNVSIYSYLLCRSMGLDYKSAARGGLLHDLFLYDWKVTKPHRGKHGSVHPKIALYNASSSFQLNDMERDIIVKHMFPVTLKPPRYKESMVVCLVDKICAALELIGVSFNDNVEEYTRQYL